MEAREATRDIIRQVQPERIFVSESGNKIGEVERIIFREIDFTRGTNRINGLIEFMAVGEWYYLDNRERLDNSSQFVRKRSKVPDTNPWKYLVDVGGFNLTKIYNSSNPLETRE